MVQKSKNHNNKVVFVVGGKGTRMGKRTEKIPKPMLPIEGAPILEHILLHVRKCGFKNFVFKTHYLPEVIERHFGTGEKYGVNIEYFVEPEPLDTAGGLSFLKDETEPVIVVYGDVLFSFNLNALLNYHKKHGADATLTTYKSDHPEDCDICIMKDNRVTSMIHKPGNDTFGNLANAALYVFEPKCFGEIPSSGAYHFDRDLLPHLIENGFNVYGHAIKPEEYIGDTGTPDRFEKARQHIAFGTLPS